MSIQTRLRLAVKIWIAIYPSITLVLFLFESQLVILPLYLRTLVLTVILVPWMIFVLLPLMDRGLALLTKQKSSMSPAGKSQGG